MLWLTGFSGSGKSTIAKALERGLFAGAAGPCSWTATTCATGCAATLDSHCEDRTENIRRAGEVARLFFESGHFVVCTFISPFATDRAFVRSLMPEGRFHEVYVNCRSRCASRATPTASTGTRSGEIRDFTGISSPYEAPSAPEMRLRTDQESVEHLVAALVLRLEDAGLVPVAPC